MWCGEKKKIAGAISLNLMGLGLIFVFCLLRVCIPDRIWVCACCVSTDWSIKVNRRSLLMVLAMVIPNGTHHHTLGYRLDIGSGDCERRVIISYHWVFPPIYLIAGQNVSISLFFSCCRRLDAIVAHIWFWFCFFCECFCWGAFIGARVEKGAQLLRLT
jgi:hypothetical protein